MAFEPWRAVPGRLLLWALNLFSAVALIFEGYNQGVMGFVNSTPSYVQTVGIGGPDGKVTNATNREAWFPPTISVPCSAASLEVDSVIALGGSVPLSLGAYSFCLVAVCRLGLEAAT